jgi:hypothetical protein
MELVVFVGAVALLAAASMRWGEDSRDYERGSGLIDVYTLEDEVRTSRMLLDWRAAVMSVLEPRRPSRRWALARTVLASAADGIGAVLVRLGMELQRRAVAA